MATKDMLIMNWQDKIPDGAGIMLQKDLESLDDSKLSALSALNLKSNVLGLVLGIFLGSWGVDRFYKGDIMLGVIKVICAIISFATFGMGFIIYGWWVFIDWFLVWKGIKKDNLQKIQNQIVLLQN